MRSSVCCIFAMAMLALLIGLVTVRAEPSPATPADAIKAMLLGTSVWRVEYLADTSFLSGAYVETGRETLTFTMRGAALKATVSYGYRGTCETDVDLSADGFRYKGCFFGEMNDIRFDPENKEYPFRSGAGPWAKHFKPQKRVNSSRQEEATP